MAYQCPRCGAPVQRGSSTTAGAAGGLVGALIYAAFGSFKCKKCGPISKSEFSSETRQKMLIGSIVMIGVAIVVAVLAIWLIITLQGARH